MCGLVGVYDSTHVMTAGVLREIVERMSERLRHRGPDDSGVWLDAESGLALGHRRLSIIDLSREGHQPMVSACGRYVIVFNGEIYNFQVLRQELEARAYRFRGHSDTEVLLAAISEWGVGAALGRLNGMFAFALWDRHLRRLHLVRDRMGEKPLYYGWLGSVFVFASELKALRATPFFDAEVDRNALALYLRLGYIPAPYSIYRGIAKLPPAAWLTLDLRTNQLSGPALYWSLKEVIVKGKAQPYGGSFAEAVSDLNALLEDAVRLRMHADVPLGAFLSGGIDSTTIVAIMQSQSTRPIQTFTVGFEEASYNEAQHAKAVAEHLGTSHTELYLTPHEALSVIPQLSEIYDEPFADPAQIPNYLISQFARRHVTVCLSGDGGDELFYGYGHYIKAETFWRRARWLPGTVRNLMGQAISRIPEKVLTAWFACLATSLSRYAQSGTVGDKLYLFADALQLRDVRQLHRWLVSHWRTPNVVVQDAHEYSGIWADAMPKGATGICDTMMYQDMNVYLPDDILVKVDRASMAVGLEVRVPLLDHRIVEFTWSLPLRFKRERKLGKRILREVLYRYVPPRLVDRPKHGFSVPISDWLRGPLRDWVEALLDESRLRQEGYFKLEPIRQKWQEHLSGKSNWQYHLWDVLMFQAWLEAQHT